MRTCSNFPWIVERVSGVREASVCNLPPQSATKDVREYAHSSLLDARLEREYGQKSVSLHVLANLAVAV
jgi:hypothetical protein